MNSNPSEILQRLILVLALAGSFFIILTYFLSMGLGILVFFSTAEGLKFIQEPYIFYPLQIIDFEVSVNSGLYFLFLWWVFALCFAAAWKYRESLSTKVREFYSGTTKPNLFSNNLLTMPIISSMLLIAVLVLEGLQSAGGIPTGSPTQTDPFLDLLRFSRAPLVEEIVFRIVPIGTFLVTYVFFAGTRTKPDLSWTQRLKICVISVLQPEKAKEKVGLKTISKKGLLGGIVWAEWIMVLFTAVLFGVAHYIGGWGPGKISQAAISGAVFALAYLYYGIQAPILLHWYFNYYFTVFELSLSYFSAEINFLSLSLATNIFFGIFMWITVLALGVVTIFKVSGRRTEITPVPKPPF